MREFADTPPPPVSGRLGLVIVHKDGSTERVDKGVHKDGFSAPIPGDEVEHNGVTYEISGVAEAPRSEFSIHVIAKEK